MEHVQTSVFSLSQAGFPGCSPGLKVFHGKFEFLQEFDFVFNSLYPVRGRQRGIQLVCSLTVGNEQADILAKEGARGEQHVNNVSFSEKKTLIRALTKPKLQRDDYHLLSRKQQVILVRLRTGHNRLNSHMHRKLKLAPSPTCPCGREEQTVEHVLQRCPLYEATREDVWPVSTSLTTKLYGCKQELEKTTSFISRAALIV